jgi:hypothetical protein
MVVITTVKYFNKWAENIIIPTTLTTKLNYKYLLQTSTFNATPPEANLLTLRTSWLEVQSIYQYVAIYSFGKSEEII